MLNGVMIMTIAQEKKAAKKEITKSIRDLLNFKITVPLGNPNYKLLHTNQFITTQLPSDFVLENFGIIGQKLASEATRSTTYVTNRWYVEAITITNNGKDAKMELELNPFASPRTQYKDNYTSFSKAYQDAQQKQTTTSPISTNKTNKTNKTGGEGKTIDNLVAKIIKGKKSDLAKAKAIHQWLINNVRYKYYECTRYNTAEKCYKNRSHLNCADTSRLTRAMMSSAGLNASVVHGPHHFWTVIKIGGKEYASDATSRQRKWNKVLDNLKYYKKNGKNPEC
jgi:hypothetical protein